MNFYHQLLQLIAHYQQKKFTGRIVFETESNIRWQLYFSLGNIVWLNGGFLPYRSWSRHLQKYANRLNYYQLSVKEYRQLELFPQTVFFALAQRNLLEGVPLDLMLNNRITEIFFDLLQVGNSQPLQIKVYQGMYKGFAAEQLKHYWNFIYAKQLILKAINKLNFCLRKEIYLSFNFAPKITKAVDFKTTNSAIFSSKLTYLFDGKFTIRELAFKLNQDEIKLFFGLYPYINRGDIELLEVSDIALKPLHYNLNNNRIKVVGTSPKPLIYCIDDNALNCYLMENIISSLGYQFISNQIPITVIPKLIKDKPDLIFLDIVMPGIDGYNLCKAIRKISTLKSVPIIMLTGEEKLSAQVRARKCGANGFIHKPIVKEKIINVVNQYLSAVRAINFCHNR